MLEGFSLPDRPDHRLYQEIVEEIVALRKTDKRRARARFRALCEADFYAFVKYATSFGRYRIKDPDHRNFGRFWVDEPFVFDRCREFQEDVSNRADDVFYNWPRFTFKTELITKNGSLWELFLDPTHTFAIITHKVDQVGEQIFLGIKQELERNRVLQVHWPDRLSPDPKNYALWTDTAMTILRPLGPKEPSFSIHGLDKLPDSGHYTRLIADDCVVAKTVENPKAIAKADRQMKRITPIGQDDTVTRWVGTIWADGDPYMQRLQNGTFSRRSFFTAWVHPDGLEWSAKAETSQWQPTLRSGRFLDKWRRKMGEFEFSCQMQGKPIARGEQTFDLTWIQEYSTKPKKEADGKKVQIFIDPAGEEEAIEGEGDYWVFRVIGVGADGYNYNLDLWRERIELNDAIHLLFALVRFWKPEATWLEQFGAQSFYSTFKREMEARNFRFTLRKLPSIKRSKESRISLLQTLYQRGEIWYPKEGFGHGSGPFYIDSLRASVSDPYLEEVRSSVTDKRDTYLQFREDEYTKWTRVKGSTLYDDMLDCESWVAQPEVQRLLPKPEDAREPDYSDGPQNSVEYNRMKRGEAGDVWGGVSGWAWL